MKTKLLFYVLAISMLFKADRLNAADPPPQPEKSYAPMPWHLVDTWWDINQESPFESLAVDVTISEDVPSSVNLYISPVGLGHLSKTPFYGGIQTQSDGYTKADPKLRSIGHGFLFSMWGERSVDAIRPSEGGFFQSSGHEGDFVSVRRPFEWKKGKYTYRLTKMDEETIDGQAYTWVGAFVYSHEKDENIFVGALRFKGEKLILDRNVANFIEIYGRQKPVSEIPKLTVTFSAPIVNGVAAKNPTATAIYPKGVPDYAETVVKDGSLVVTVEQPVEGREKRQVKLIAAAAAPETSGGWTKYAGNPVMGGDLGTCFDISVLRENDVYRMWFSWRPKKSIALVESKDGIHWDAPEIVIGPNPKTDWESDLNRPVVIKTGDVCRMWYTGQAKGKSWIGYAISKDGKTWERQSNQPVLSADTPWEKVAVMCPHVIYDEQPKTYRMWYSGGEQGEPNAIGYATSEDGLKWSKHKDNPIFAADPKSAWEKDRVTACQVIPQGDGFLMFYIGFRDESHAQIGIAKSKDGITNWTRLAANPIIRPGLNKWDHDAVYKPYAIFDGKKWLLWYNGRHGGVEQIGLAEHEGEDLGF